MIDLTNRISQIGIVPVVKILNKEDAFPLAKALYEGGIDVAEITFRSAYATDAIATIHKELPDMLVGAGTVLTIDQAKEAVEAGASFIITPGFNKAVVAWCIEHDVVVYPGVSTASEIEEALSYGLHTLKFFPAESSGGAKKLKDFAAPYPDITFLPTGGINESNLHDYLSLPNVLAVGGSFMLPNEFVSTKNWDAIRTLCKKAIKTMLGFSLIHIGINSDNIQEAQHTADTLCQLFDFHPYQKPKSKFAGKGFEILHGLGKGSHGHIGIYTNYVMRAMYQLQKKGVRFDESTITRNKQTNLINFVYLDMELSGFGIHLIHPDVDMEV
ncbi:bifunctional 4-hydroxy-2-oxoglutarate aldolase/2-dehydro-3-deoxy-phosphogluconate aldolase [[Eubacterium] hominis]|uniref:bifunctional 4-hydroxy-2-oxoglutarate aldolase/2-dehydro-3-deoxy-phosphogluconate aldolase n=1 Tax=[Eubacterium] hominis TaxID=2764325 RepID=UPI003A4E5E7D